MVQPWRVIFVMSTLLTVLTLLLTLPDLFTLTHLLTTACASHRRNYISNSTSTATSKETVSTKHKQFISSTNISNGHPSQSLVHPSLLENRMQKKLLEIESTLYFHHSPQSKPLVAAKDVSYGRYYAQRDLQGWTLSFQNLSFEVVERSARTPVKLAELSVFLCLGIQSQDKHCIKPNSYRLLTRTQKYNQIHGLRDILWRKDSFCYTMREALSSYKGKKSFIFPCWVLPKDNEKLEERMNRERKDWIVKPCGQGEGHGIFVVNNFTEISSRPQNPDGFVVQPLLNDPYLVNGKKFDLRTYVLVTSITPLRAYIYKEGLVRFASSKYDKNATRGGKEQQFLTNTSVGKKYTHLSNLTWTYQKLKEYLTLAGVNSDAVFESMNDAIVRTLLAAEFRFLRDFMVNLGGYDCQSCFQLLGVDVIFDSKLNPIVIEVNGLPSMQLSHDLGALPNPNNAYTATKFGLMHDLINILFKPTSVAEELSRDFARLRVGIKPGPLCDPEYHVLCIDHKQVEKLLDSKREYNNRGGYQRIYPSPSGSKYSKLISHMSELIERKFVDVSTHRLWEVHHLYTALEKLYTLQK